MKTFHIRADMHFESMPPAEDIAKALQSIPNIRSAEILPWNDDMEALVHTTRQVRTMERRLIVAMVLGGFALGCAVLSFIGDIRFATPLAMVAFGASWGLVLMHWNEIVMNRRQR